MGIALVPHVENQPVALKVENPVEGHGDLHCAQIGCQMSARTGDCIDQTGAEPGAEGLSLAVGHFFQIRDIRLLNHKHLPGDGARLR